MTLRGHLFPAGFVYEVRRAFVRPAVLMVFIVTILVALASATQVATNPPDFARNYSGAVFYFGGAYHFEFYTFDQYGSPIPGIDYTLQFSSASGSKSLANASGVSPSHGILDVVFPLPQGTYMVSYTAGPQNGGPYWSQGQSNGVFQLDPIPQGQVLPLLSPLTSAIDLTTGFSGTPALQVFLPNPGGSSVGTDSIYYTLVDLQNGALASPLPRSAMTFLGNLQSALQSFPLSIHPNSSTPSLNLQVEVFSPSETLLLLDTNASASEFSPYETATSVSDAAFSYFSSDMDLLVPLMAVVASFSVYAKDRIAGVLESVVVLPVTRPGLAASRLVAISAAMLGALLLGVGLSDAAIHQVVGYYVFPSYLVAVYLGFAVSTIFFTGVTFLLSHLLRSHAALLGITIAIFLLFGILWYSLDSAVAAGLGVLVGTPGGARFQVISSFFDPIQYPSLLLAGLTNSTPGAASQLGGPPSSYGITPVSLLLVAGVWTVIPLVLLSWRIRTRD